MMPSLRAMKVLPWQSGQPKTLFVSVKNKRMHIDQCTLSLVAQGASLAASTGVQ